MRLVHQAQGRGLQQARVPDLGGQERRAARARLPPQDAAQRRPEEAERELALLHKVTQKNKATTKSEEVLTIAHLCGNIFCVRPSHLRVVPKATNEEHTHCHWIQEAQLADDNLKKVFLRSKCLLFN